jgi:hypothetical protein
MANPIGQNKINTTPKNKEIYLYDNIIVIVIVIVILSKMNFVGFTFGFEGCTDSE